MILSFSVASMRPYIEAGARQACGHDVGDVRVKRQTIRAHGPRAAQLLAIDPICHTIPYGLDLWWKSRTKERARLGSVPGARVYSIEILHSTVIWETERQCIRITAPWDHTNNVYFWSPGDEKNAFTRFAHADGFESPEEFRDYFVPNLGDQFSGILYRW